MMFDETSDKNQCVVKDIYPWNDGNEYKLTINLHSKAQNLLGRLWLFGGFQPVSRIENTKCT